VIAKYCSLCSICNRTTKQVLQSKIIPIKSSKFWERIQIDLVDMRHKPDKQNNKEYQYIAHVIDHFSGFNIIWPMEHKSGEEVAQGLIIFVFSCYGLPNILHSDSGLEFKNKLVTSLVDRWSGSCKIVHGRPRCPWVQGKVEQSNGCSSSGTCKNSCFYDGRKAN
jgi:transposase InsO family protein